MKNSNLTALLKECCLELGIEWVDEPGPAVIDGKKQTSILKIILFFPSILTINDFSYKILLL